MNASYLTRAYSIQQVADMTGLSKQVIRKWEERYELVEPQRLDNGYRMYSDADINTILTVKSLAEQGHSIKQAALLAKTGEQSIQFQIHPEQELHDEHEPMNDYVLQLLQHGTNCNESEIILTLQQAYHHLGLDLLITSVITPFLKEIGQRWQKKQWNEYQEALASIVIRDFLIQIRQNFQYRDNAPLLLGACLPNEQHEVPVHLLLLQMMLKGWKTMLIGASPAPGSIESMVEKLKPKKVLLSATTTIPFKMDPELVTRLDHFAVNHKNIDFYLGGTGAITYTKGMKLQAIEITSSIEDILKTKVGKEP